MGKVDIVGHQTLETMAFAKWYNKWLYSLMEGYLGTKILEVGVGIGNFTKLLAKKGYVTAIDIQNSYLSELKRGGLKNTKFGYGDIEKGKYFFGNAKFDSAVCLNVLEHIKNDETALKNMNELLKKNGRLILLVPAFNVLFCDFDTALGHYRRYTMNGLVTKLKKAGFKITYNRYLNWWAAIGWFLFIKLPGEKKMPQPPVKIFDIIGRLFLLPERFIKIPFGLSVFIIASKK